jgi:hypothetical protein
MAFFCASVRGKCSWPNKLSMGISKLPLTLPACTLSSSEPTPWEWAACACLSWAKANGAAMQKSPKLAAVRKHFMRTPFLKNHTMKITKLNAQIKPTKSCEISVWFKKTTANQA